jgi:tetratricopeptide (TPR) repeat protein
MSRLALDEIKLEDIDFEGVKNCTDKHVIKRYIKLLEDDGVYFVELHKACKEKFLELDPKGYYLLYPKATTSTEFDEAHRDLLDWEASVTETDKALRESKKSRDKDVIWDDELGAKVSVPIRGQEPVTISRPNLHKEPEARRIKDEHKKPDDQSARDKTKMKDYYNAWDRVDVDEIEDEFDRKEAEENEAKRKHFEDLKDQQDEAHHTTPIGSAAKVPEAHRRHMADCEKEKGNEAFYAKDFEEAEAYYSRSLSFKADDPSTWANRALVRLKLSRAAEALEDCEHGLALNPRYMKGLHRKGKALHELERYEEAVKFFQLALAESPGNTQINGDLMVARRKLRTEPAAPAPAAPVQQRCRIEELPDDSNEKPRNYTRVVIEEDSDSEDDVVPPTDRGFRKVVIEEVDGSESEGDVSPTLLGDSTGGAGNESAGDVECDCGGTGETASRDASSGVETGFRKVHIVEDSGSDEELAPVATSQAFAPPARATAVQTSQAQPVTGMGCGSFGDMD